MSTHRRRLCSAPPWAALILVLSAGLTPSSVRAQERPPYLLGETQGLEMIVHIIGDVQKPGEYRVPDHTNLLELLSKAGGPTEFSRLSEVTVRRSVGSWLVADTQGSYPAPRVAILHINLERAMRDSAAAPPPILRPGDVIFVPKNSRQKWLDVSTVVRDLSIVASSYFLYLRATK